MPLIPGSSNYDVGRNISKLEEESRPKKQAIAIALHIAGKGKDQTKPPRYRDGARLTNLKMPHVAMNAD